MQFHIITLFPEMFDSYLGESILARAIKEKRIKVNFVNPRKFVTGKYRKVWPDGNISQQIDERPYGGGPGMVMMAEPILRSVESVIVSISKKFSKSSDLLASKQKGSARLKKSFEISTPKIKIINFVPSAKKFDTAYAKKLARTSRKGGYTDIILICGRYEGIDARVDTILKKEFKKDFEQISIGDYVLTGGELPAMIMIDCISRQVAGVLGNFDSREEERISSSEVYTRPEVIYVSKEKSFRKVLGSPSSHVKKGTRPDHSKKTFPSSHKILKYSVPKVLLSGDHKKIEEWKKGLQK